MGRYFESMQICCFSLSICPLNFSFIGGLLQIITLVFHWFFFFFTFNNWTASLRKTHFSLILKFTIILVWTQENPVLLFIYFIAHIFLALAISSSVGSASVSASESFLAFTTNTWYYLIPEEAPGPSCVFPAQLWGQPLF